jgi:hypothetical protein
LLLASLATKTLVPQESRVGGMPIGQMSLLPERPKCTNSRNPSGGASPWRGRGAEAGAGAQVSVQAIDATVGALAPALDVGRVFTGVALGVPHALRCIICYRGHHYCALALSEELQRWLLFDDAHVRCPGWQPPMPLPAPGLCL